MWKDQAEGEADSEDEEAIPAGGAGDASGGDQICQVRWIKHVEKLPVDEEEDSDQEDEDHQASGTASPAAESTRPSATAPQASGKGPDEHPKREAHLDWFRVACVVQLKDIALREADKNQEKPAKDLKFAIKLCEKLKMWPKQTKAKADDSKTSKECVEKDMEIMKKEDMLQALQILDYGGLITKFERIGSIEVNPCDLLLLDNFAEEYSRMRANDGAGVSNLKFLPSMRLARANVEIEAPYAELHGHFRRFEEEDELILPNKEELPEPRAFVAGDWKCKECEQDNDAKYSHCTWCGRWQCPIADCRGCNEKNVFQCAHCPSFFGTLALEIKSAKDAKVRAAGKVPPVRIRNLSAERNPKLAGERGCK